MNSSGLRIPIYISVLKPSRKKIFRKNAYKKRYKKGSIPYSTVKFYGKGAFKKSLPTLSQIRTTHNSFARQTLFEFDSKKAEKDDDVFHFVRQERFYKSFLVKDIKF